MAKQPTTTAKTIKDLPRDNSPVAIFFVYFASVSRTWISVRNGFFFVVGVFLLRWCELLSHSFCCVVWGAAVDSGKHPPSSAMRTQLTDAAESGHSTSILCLAPASGDGAQKRRPT
jgi:hypothetical protein